MFPSSSEPANNCLSDWNYKDPTRLLTLIQYLRSFFFFFFYSSWLWWFCFDIHFSCCLYRDQYVLYQRKRVGEVDDDRLTFEISTILSREVIWFQFSSFEDILKFWVSVVTLSIAVLEYVVFWHADSVISVDFYVAHMW